MRLLVVEDDPDLNRQLTTALTDAGYVVDRAFDGEEGHFLGDSEPYDAVVLDIGLPKLNGYEVCRCLRRKAWTARTTIVAVTGWGQEDDRRRSREAGFDHHLVKPVDSQALMQLIGRRRGGADSGLTRPISRG